MDWPAELIAFDLQHQSDNATEGDQSNTKKRYPSLFYEFVQTFVCRSRWNEAAVPESAMDESTSNNSAAQDEAGEPKQKKRCRWGGQLPEEGDAAPASTETGESDKKLKKTRWGA